MGEGTAIEWAHHTFNPWIGCEKVSPGCRNCYAERYGARFGAGWGLPYRRTKPSNWNMVRRWNRAAQAMIDAGAPRDVASPRVFCASLADVFDTKAPAEWLADLLELITETPALTWLLLTKRPQLWEARLRAAAVVGAAAESLAAAWLEPWSCTDERGEPFVPSNVWVGTTVEDQERADQRIPALLAIPARVRFLSCEPLLGPVVLDDGLYDEPYQGSDELGMTRDPLDEDGVRWVICGGESGPKARPMHPAWARSLRDQCQAAGVAFHFKQWGDLAPRGPSLWSGWQGSLDASGRASVTAHGYVFEGIGKKAAGRLLDGRTWDEVPRVA